MRQTCDVDLPPSGSRRLAGVSFVLALGLLGVADAAVSAIAAKAVDGGSSAVSTDTPAERQAVAAQRQQAVQRALDFKPMPRVRASAERGLSRDAFEFEPRAVATPCLAGSVDPVPSAPCAGPGEERSSDGANVRGQRDDMRADPLRQVSAETQQNPPTLAPRRRAR